MYVDGDGDVTIGDRDHHTIDTEAATVDEVVKVDTISDDEEITRAIEGNRSTLGRGPRRVSR